MPKSEEKCYSKHFKNFETQKKFCDTKPKPVVRKIKLISMWVISAHFYG